MFRGPPLSLPPLPLRLCPSTSLLSPLLSHPLTRIAIYILHSTAFLRPILMSAPSAYAPSAFFAHPSLTSSNILIRSYERPHDQLRFGRQRGDKKPFLADPFLRDSSRPRRRSFHGGLQTQGRIKLIWTPTFGLRSFHRLLWCDHHRSPLASAVRTLPSFSAVRPEIILAVADPGDVRVRRRFDAGRQCTRKKNCRRTFAAAGADSPANPGGRRPNVEWHRSSPTGGIGRSHRLAGRE